MAADFSGRDLAYGTGDEPGIRITLAQVRAFLPRYKWLISGVLAFTVVSTYAALSLTTELYEVNSSLLVKIGRENLDAPVTARNAVFSTGVRREELGSEVAIIRSASLLNEVVDEIGVEAFRINRVPPDDLIGMVKFYTKAGLRWVKEQYQEGLIALDLKKRLSEREGVVAQLADRLSVEPQKDADVITLSLRFPNPDLAAQVQQLLIEKYLAHRIGVRQNSGVREFFEREVAELRARLDEAETQVRQWKGRQALTLPGEQKALLLRQIREVSASRERAASRSQALTNQVNAARGLISGTAERVRATQTETPSLATQHLRERLSRLEGDRARLLTTYFPTAAPVKTVEDEIASVRALMAQVERSEVGSVTTELNPLRQQLETSANTDTIALEGLNGELEVYERQLSQLGAELRAIDNADARLTQLERERAIAESNYVAGVKRLSDAVVEAQLDVSRISNVTVATPPTASLQPVYPRKLLLMALSIGLGLALGVAFALALEWASDTVHATEELESATELVCLASFRENRGRARGAA